MFQKKTLEETKEFELIFPPDGFSSDFLDSLINVCKEYSNLEEAYVALKKINSGGSGLFFGFLFNKKYPVNDRDTSIQNIIESVLGLFKDELVVDAVCLNGQDQLYQNLNSFTDPFYVKEFQRFAT